MLYCYRVNENTGEIRKYTIKDYVEQKRKYGNTMEYSFKQDLGTGVVYPYYLTNDKLNRYSKEKYFTFNDNEQEVVRDILDAISEKEAQYSRKATRFNLIGTRIRRWEGIE